MIKMISVTTMTLIYNSFWEGFRLSALLYSAIG